MTPAPATGEPSREELERRLAQTYTRVSDPWAQVENYRSVMEYVASHPDAGPTAIARACDQPRSRIRPWLEGTVPDAVRAITVASQKGWLSMAWDTAVSRAMNVFVAWVYSGGSISTDAYVPRFAIEDETAATLIKRAFQAVTLQYQTQRAETTSRATEAVPTTHGSLFGRTLIAWGAPSGPKSRTRGLSLPEYVHTAPDTIRRDFARTYVLNRSTSRNDRPRRPIQLYEERSNAFRQELRTFLQTIVPDEGVHLSGDSLLFLSSTAAEILGHPPAINKGASQRTGRDP